MNNSITLFRGATAVLLCCLLTDASVLAYKSRNRASEREAPCVTCLSNATNDGTEGMSELMKAVLQESDEEERLLTFINKGDVKAFLAKDKYVESTGQFISTGFTSIAALVYMDYKQEPAALVKAIGDALVPIIALGLALIPVIGPIIAGVFTGLWALFSPLIHQEESVESKMEKMINEAMKKVTKQTDDKLATLLSGSIRGELTRNQYVCDKYSIIAGNFSQNWAEVGNISDTFRLEMIMFLDNCDDYLKDTAEAFVHPYFADALWMPSVMTTLIRTAFLTDVINYAHILRLPQKFKENYFKEMKADIKRHFNLHALGMSKRMTSIEDTKGLSEEEMTSCKMQKELLFLDRSLYPYGVPRTFVNHDNNFALTVREFTMYNYKEQRRKEFEHIQFIFDATNNHILGKYKTIRVLNCYMGLTLQNIPFTDFFVPFVQYEPGYSYNFRLLYFTIEKVIYSGDENKFKQNQNFKNKVKGNSTNINNDVLIKVEDDPDQIGHHVLFEADATFIAPQCIAYPVSEERKYIPCFSYKTEAAFEGKFVIDDVATYNMDGEHQRDRRRVNGNIKVTSNPRQIVLVAVELIVRERIDVKVETAKSGH